MMDWESSAYKSEEDKIIQKKHINWEGKWLRKEVIRKFSPLLVAEGRREQQVRESTRPEKQSN